MDFVGSFPTTKKGHDYLFVVVYRFRKMCILMPCKKIIKGQVVENMFLNGSGCTFKEHHLTQGYQIYQCLLDYTLGEYGHQVEEIYNIPSTNKWVDKSSQ
jgi:hypothetical protein